MYTINVKGHAPILLGAMYLTPDGENGPQVGGGLTRWHSHLEVARAARSSSPGSTSRCPVSATRPPGRTSTPPRCCTSGHPLPGRGLLRRPEQRGDDRRRPGRARGNQARAAGAVTLVTASKTRPIPPANEVCNCLLLGWSFSSGRRRVNRDMWLHTSGTSATSTSGTNPR